MKPEPTTSDRPDALSNDEWRLVRLFRLLTDVRQHDVLCELGKQLLARYSIDTRVSAASDPNAIADELPDDLDRRLEAAIPWNTQITDLCDYDYPIIEYGVGAGWDLIEIVFGASDDDHRLATRLGEAYAEGLRNNGAPTMTDFGATAEEQREEYEAEGRRFFDEWRERVVALLERRIELPLDGDSADEA